MSYLYPGLQAAQFEVSIHNWIHSPASKRYHTTIFTEPAEAYYSATDSSMQPATRVLQSTSGVLAAGTCALILVTAWADAKVQPAIAASTVPALTAAQKKQVRGWIKDLGSRQYVRRQQAQTKLLTTGWPALPWLLQAQRDPHPERRFRARQLAREIQHRRLHREFQHLGLQPENAINLDLAMISIARIVDPLVDDASLTRQLDQLANRVRKLLGPNVSLEKVPPAQAVAMIQQVLFQQHGFTGAKAEYDHPRNSSLEKVLQTRKGLPILLSHVVVAVADRLDWPFVGVPVPGRYMVKYDGSQAPAGTPKKDILLDPFGGGKILTLEQLLEIVPSLDPETALTPSPRRETVVRMLRNLEADYMAIGNLEQAEQTARYLGLVDR